MEYRLVEKGGRSFTIQEGQSLRVGRGEECEWQMDFEGVSRQHCRFFLFNGQLFVSDLDSKNGTFLKGKRIKESPLKVGDLVMVSKARKIRIESPTAEGAPTEASAQDMADDAPTPDAAELASAARSLPPPPSQALAVREQAASALAVSAPMPMPGVSPANPQRKRLLIVAGVTLFLVILAVLAKLSRPADVPAGPAPAEHYDRLIASAVEDFEAQAYQSSSQKAVQAVSLVSHNSVALILRDLAEIWHQHHSDVLSLPLAKVETLAKELYAARPTTPEVKALAEKQLAWIKREEPSVRQLHRLRILESDGKWEEAVSVSGKVAGDSVFRIMYSTLFGSLEANYRQEVLSRARGQYGNKRWLESVQTYELYATRFAPESVPEEVPQKIELAQRYDRDRENLALAEQASEKGDWDDVRSRSADIREDSPYRERADALKNRSEEVEIDEKITDEYRSGKADEALATIESAPNNERTTLAQRIRAVVKALEDAKAALEKRDPERAVALWRSVIQLEAYEGNHYRREAQQGLDEWDDASRLAQQYKAWGDEAFMDKKFPEARAHYERAQAISEGVATDVLKKMDNDGTRLYNQASNIYKDRPVDAMEKLQHALELISPRHALYSNIQDLLKKIKG